MVCRPKRTWRFSISFSSVVIRRTPVAPSGCPSAMAPPFTFTRLKSAPTSRCQASTTLAKASLISIRPMSSNFMPAFCKARRVAGMGAVSIHTGSSANTER